MSFIKINWAFLFPITIKLIHDEVEIHLWAASDEKWKSKGEALSARPIVSGAESFLAGFAYKFTGTDKMIDELAEFVKTERACCDFFIFNLSISGDKSEAWLEISGPKGAKDFITTEFEM